MLRIDEGRPAPLGATWDGCGVNFAVFSAHATAIDLCLFDPTGRKQTRRMAGVRVEDEAVFEATHALIFRLIDEGRVHGVRIDHVDGLADPKTYLQRRRRRLGPHFCTRARRKAA